MLIHKLHSLITGFRDSISYYPTRSLAFHFASEAYGQTIEHNEGTSSLQAKSFPGWTALDATIAYPEATQSTSKSKTHQSKATPYLSADESTLVLSFEGTYSMNDLKGDINQVLLGRSNEYFKAIEKFIEELLHRDPIKKRLNSALPPLRILCTGHSLGAWFARHAALTLCIIKKRHSNDIGPFDIHMILVDAPGFGDRQTFSRFSHHPNDPDAAAAAAAPEHEPEPEPEQDLVITADEARELLGNYTIHAENNCLQPNAVNACGNTETETKFQIASANRTNLSTAFRKVMKTFTRALLRTVAHREPVDLLESAAASHPISLFYDKTNPDLLGSRVIEGWPQLVLAEDYHEKSTFQNIKALKVRTNGELVVRAEERALLLSRFNDEERAQLIEHLRDDNHGWFVLAYFRQKMELSVCEDRIILVGSADISLDECDHFLRHFLAMSEDEKACTLDKIKEESKELLRQKLVFELKTLDGPLIMTPERRERLCREFLFLEAGDINEVLADNTLFQPCDEHENCYQLPEQTNVTAAAYASYLDLIRKAEEGTPLHREFLFLENWKENLTASTGRAFTLSQKVKAISCKQFHDLLQQASYDAISFSKFLEIQEQQQQNNFALLSDTNKLLEALTTSTEISEQEKINFILENLPIYRISVEDVSSLTNNAALFSEFCRYLIHLNQFSSEVVQSNVLAMINILNLNNLDDQIYYDFFDLLDKLTTQPSSVNQDFNETLGTIIKQMLVFYQAYSDPDALISVEDMTILETFSRSFQNNIRIQEVLAAQQLLQRNHDEDASLSDDVASDLLASVSAVEEEVSDEDSDFAGSSSVFMSTNPSPNNSSGAEEENVNLLIIAISEAVNKYVIWIDNAIKERNAGRHGGNGQQRAIAFKKEVNKEGKTFSDICNLLHDLFSNNFNYENKPFFSGSPTRTKDHSFISFFMTILATGNYISVVAMLNENTRHTRTADLSITPDQDYTQHEIVTDERVTKSHRVIRNERAAACRFFASIEKVSATSHSLS